MSRGPELRTIRTCRVCGSAKLERILSLGRIYVSDFVTDRTATSEKRYPLELVLCDPAQRRGCGLLQLKHTVDPSKMYNFYYYQSGANAMMREALADIVRQAQNRAKLRPGDLVLDIGCNDGTLLRSYSVRGIQTVGFDPAKNLIPKASVGTTEIFNNYFNHAAFARRFGAKKANVITSIAMFYDLDDPNTFVRDIARCLHKDGWWIIQMAYLPSMLEQNAFDNICHEHLEYYSMLSLEFLLKRHRLKAVDVELNDVNGGSYRVYVRHQGRPVSAQGASRLAALRDRERKMALGDKRTYAAFAQRVDKIRRQVLGFVRRETGKGKDVYVYGASTKGNTLLQYFGVDHRLIRAAAERNPDKFGKKTVGSWIPIMSEEQARRDRPDYFLVLPWHFLKGFLKQEKAYFRSGGRFIVPLPKFKIIPPLKTRKK